VRRLLPTLRLDTGVVVAASSGTPSLWGNRLQPGDVIFRIADRRVRTLQDLHKALLLHDDTRILVTQVQRGFPLQYLACGQLNRGAGRTRSGLHPLLSGAIFLTCCSSHA